MVAEHPSLLITDDDRAFRETLREVFEPRGFRTLLAGDGEQAIEIVRREPVHLALLDMHMPRVTGLEAIRQFKREQLPLPCILISAALDESLVAEALAAEVYSVLPKPVSFAEITRLVNQAMRQNYQWYEGR